MIMSKIESIVKEYSSKKLKEIIEEQAFSYNETFIDHAKDELIKRGEKFQYNPELEKTIEAMSDEDLKNAVEKEWRDYHLESMEIARREYLKRNFKNESIEEETKQPEKKKTDKRYPALRIIAVLSQILAFIVGVVALYITYDIGITNEVGFLTLIIGALIVLGLIAAAESIKVIIAIENNTRKTAE